MNEPPQPTGRVVRDFDLLGKLCMWERGQPVLVHAHGEEALCLPVFSSKDKLVAAAKAFHLPYDRIKRIDDHDLFLADMSSLFPGIHIIADLRKHKGKVRYLLLQDGAN